jgi:hypothetical protein
MSSEAIKHNGYYVEELPDGAGITLQRMDTKEKTMFSIMMSDNKSPDCQVIKILLEPRQFRRLKLAMELLGEL